MRVWGLSAFTGLFLAFGASAASPAIHVTEDFSTDPSGRWAVSGDASRYSWDSSEGHLNVTWDSSKPKSFFWIPIGKKVCRYDDFSFEFDLNLSDIASGTEEGKTGPMQVGIGFLNAQATNADWSRVDWGSSPNVVEFNTYPDGSYDGIPVSPTTAPSLVASNGNGYLQSLDDFKIALPLGQVVHVKMEFEAQTQILTAVWTTNGVPIDRVHRLLLGGEILFAATEDFQVDMFSISNYKSNEGPYADSLLAHGTVDNISFTIPPPPVIVKNSGLVDGSWQITILPRAQWTYSLERSMDLNSWDSVTQPISGSGSDLTLVDPNAPAGKAFYRVRADE